MPCVVLDVPLFFTLRWEEETELETVTGGRSSIRGEQASIDSSLFFVAPLHEATPTVAVPTSCVSQACESRTMSCSLIAWCGLTQKPTIGQVRPVEAQSNLPAASRLFYTIKENLEVPLLI